MRRNTFINTTMKALLCLACIAATPVAASGQAAITGLVSDVSGASLSGVAVDATSPALIEKVRATVTDDKGQYRIENLRPGSYTLTFVRPGFETHVRDGVELSGSFTATIDVEMTLGAVAETVTIVGGISPVDLHTTSHDVSLSGDDVRSLPTVRTYNALLVLIPGVVTTTNDTVTGTATVSFPIHGGRGPEGRLSLDGLTVGSPPAGNSAASYVVDLGQAQAVTFSTSGGLGETETGGLLMNIVPKTGGNATQASLFASGTGQKFQSDNLTDALRARGVAAATPLTRVYDFSGTFGGPLQKDRAWFFASAHTGGSTKDDASVYYNLNASDATKWLYAPDFSRREYSDRTFENASARATFQVTPRHKTGIFWDEQVLCRTCTGATPGLSEPARISPEAVGVLGRPLRVVQATWSAPLTSRLFVEAGFGGTSFGVGNFERSPNPTRDLIRVAEQCSRGCDANGSIPGLVYRSQDFSTAHTGSYLWKASLSHVTGSHSLKIGMQHTFMTDDRTWMTNDENLTYRVDNGVPNQLTESISPWVNDARAAWDAIFVQQQWTRRRLTLQGALRFDRARSWFPMQQEGPSRFLPTPILIPETSGVDSYKDITTRIGAAYDLFGNGKTALRATLGKYLEGAGIQGTYASANPTLRMPQTTMAFGTAGVTRSWIDANGNFIPDCDLLNPNMQDRRAGGDMCGVVSNTSFGQDVLTNSFDPALLSGWGVRPSDWRLGVSIQHEIVPGASLDVTYNRRWYRGFPVVDNLALQPSDLTPYSIVAPLDSRLPMGGGYVVPGLYDVVPDKAGQVSNLVTDSSRYGTWSQYFSGVDITVNVRRNNLTIQGGTSTGQNVADNCDVRAHLPELATTAMGTAAFGGGLTGSAVTPASPYCHVAFGILTQARGFASYLAPKGNIQLAMTFQSKPGAMLAANYAVPNSAVVASLGRNLAGNAPNVTVNLVQPGTLYGDRINQLDWRVAKTFGYRRSKATIAVDIFNALNSSVVLTYGSSFVPGGTWLQPSSILTPRVFRFMTEVDF